MKRTEVNSFRKMLKGHDKWRKVLSKKNCFNKHLNT